jgi:hypothetical protein
MHFHGSSERERRHSVGQLEHDRIDEYKKWYMILLIAHRVHVPEARGRVMPDIDSISEDFPAD